MKKEKTIIFNSGKCAWGKCIFCGWSKLEFPVDIEKLKKQFDKEIEKAEGVETVKIFGSGSFLDDRQFPREFRKYVIEKCKEKGIKHLIVESRPEFIRDELLRDFEGIKLTVAIGLEVADDKILKKINKGFITKDYIKAVKTLRKHGCGVRTYLLVGLPFVKNQQKTLDKSVRFALKYSDSVVLINLFPHSKAPLFDMWIKREWKPLDEKQFNKLVSKWRKNKKVETDFNNFAFIPRFPKSKQEFIRGATVENLLHPHFEVWQDYFCRFFKVSPEKKYALFVLCAYRKPYTKSKSWRAMLRVLSRFKYFKKIHILTISSPGVIPYEFIRYYPFTSYDWPEWEETGEVKKAYLRVTQKRIENYLKAHKKDYKKFFAYLPPNSLSFKALERACKKLKIRLINCFPKEIYEKVKDRRPVVTTEEALESLEKALKKNGVK